MEEAIELSKRPKTEESHAFTEEDAQGIQFPHNNAMVIIINIANYDVRCILIDNESSTDILFYDAFSQMDIPSK